MMKERRALCPGKSGLQCSTLSKSQPNKKKRKKTTDHDKYERALEEAVVARRVRSKKNKKNDKLVNKSKNSNVNHSASSMAQEE